MRRHILYLLMMLAVVFALAAYNFNDLWLLDEPLLLTGFSANDLEDVAGEPAQLIPVIYDAQHHNIFHIKLKNNNINNILFKFKLFSEGYIRLGLAEEYILVADENNTIIEKIYWPRKNGQVETIQVDHQDHVYIHSVYYDAYHAYVIKETLWCYTLKSKNLRPIYNAAYKPADRPYANGKIRGLQPTAKGIAFFVYSMNDRILKSFKYEGQMEPVFDVVVPEGVILMDLFGWDRGGVIYSTVESSVGQIDYNGDFKSLKSYLGENATIKEMKKINDGLYITSSNGTLDELELNNAGYGFKRISYNQGSTDTFMSTWVEKPVPAPFLPYSAGLLWNKYFKASLNGIAFVLFLYSMWFMYVYIWQRRVMMTVKLLGLVVPLMIIAILYSVYFVVSRQTIDFGDDIQEGKLFQFDGVINAATEQLNEEEGQGFLASYLQGIVPYKAIGTDEYKEFSAMLELDGLKTAKYGLDQDTINDMSGMYMVLDMVKDGKSYKVYDTENQFRMFEERSTDDSFITRTMAGETVYGIKGNYIFSLRPIYNDTKNVVGIMQVGMDYMGYKTRNDYILLNLVVKSIVWISSIFIPIMVLIIFFILRPIGIFTRTVKGMTGDNLGQQVILSTRDEIEDLSEEFNRLTGQIATTIKEITLMSSSYHRFVPQELFALLGKEKVTEIELGDHSRIKTTILCAGINNFYEISEDLGQKESFDLINAHLEVMGPIIREYGGMVDKYLDVGIVAMFPEAADHAVKAAIDIHRHIETLRADPNSKYKALDIAIHQGDILVGIIGEEKRIQSSIVSDIVNLCMLMQSKAAALSSRILISKEAFEDLKEMYQHRLLGCIKPIGRQKGIEVVDIFEADPEADYALKVKSSETFSTAVQAFSKGAYQKARTQFVRVLEKNINDSVARLYFYEVDKRLDATERNEEVEKSELII